MDIGQMVFTAHKAKCGRERGKEGCDRMKGVAIPIAHVLVYIFSYHLFKLRRISPWH
jgi:hypothetical protein